MKRIRIGICIEDEIYSGRFTSCLMNHYISQFEIHIFTGYDQLMSQNEINMDAVIVGDCIENNGQINELRKRIKIPIFYLFDFEEKDAKFEEKEGEVFIVEKYQEVNFIVDEILKNIGDEIKDVREHGHIRVKTRVAAVYSLSENEFQLPFAVTLGDILGEKERVLVIDLQENSGFKQLINQDVTQGLEELLIMAAGGKYSCGRMVASIGHMGSLDYVYPINNTESLCELNAALCLKLIQMICQEMDYDVLIINLGVRFQGFFEFLNRCNEVYLMQKRGGIYQWRELEFMAELTTRGYQSIVDKLVRIELPIMSKPITSCERLIEQWRWNEFGDLIRNMIPGALAVG